MKKATTRRALTLGALALLGFFVVVAVRSFGSAGHEPGTMAVAAPARAVPTSPTSASVTPVSTPPIAPIPAPETAAPSEQVGQAQGDIHFQQEPRASGPQGRSIDMVVRAGLGVWVPAESRMRILLLESAPAEANIAQLKEALLSTGGQGGRSALIELKFIPTAQAFDINELESATLTVRDGLASSSANALSGLSWSGSLPSPQLELPPGSEHPRIELTSNGDTVAPEGEMWRQSWRLSLSVPVIMGY